MFSKFIKRNKIVAEANPTSLHVIAAEDRWESRLQAAIGNDSELLALAIDAPSVDYKLTCVRALASEEGLKLAEREFRKHDRRVHSLAKERYESLVKQRETRAKAADLIQAATALVEAPVIPANRLAELNQAWELLDAVLIEDEHKFRFAKLQADLTERMRESVERKRDAGHWSTAAQNTLEELSSACTAVAAAGTEQPELAALLASASEKARSALLSIPATSPSPVPRIAELAAAIQSTLQNSALIEGRLAILCELQASQVLRHDTLSDEKSSPPPAAIATAAIERWQQLPSISDKNIENALQARFEEYLRLLNESVRKVQKQNSVIAKEKNQAAQQARTQELAIAADAMEAALAAGHLAEAENQLAILQTVSGKGGTSPAMQKRIGALQSEFTRLKGWQHWGGGRARDDLVLEAEALATSTVVAEGSQPVKLPFKQLENSIDQLRTRWKELDRLGGATSKSLWQRFDGALKTAYLPVAAHLAQLNEARQENLIARKNLLIGLDALDITFDEQKGPDWKKIERSLTHFQTEWRKLGPVEHTVPHKSRPALLEHMKASVGRLEDPLKEMQVRAQSERKQLIDRAKALSQDTQGRDMLVKLRGLQSQWQSHAKSQPLPRKTENLLWAEFKAATDAIMSRREAEFSARDAELKTNQTMREALIAQLEELHEDTPTPYIKQVLASVDAEWRKVGEAPRNQADKLESRYRAAREQAHKNAAGSVQRSWQLTCDALLVKLALCEELESAPLSTDIQARWEKLPALPARWESALQMRYESDRINPNGGDPGNSAEPFDQLLLRIESSLEIPSPAAFQMDRQTLKLQELKNAMEGRRSITPASSDVEKMTTAALGYTHLSPDQRSRLQAIIAALRSLGPGSIQA